MTIMVQDDPVKEMESLGSIQDQTWLNADRILRTIFYQAPENQSFEMAGMQNLVNNILDYILGSSYVLFNLQRISAYDKYTFSHSVHVCVISAMIGSMMNLGRADMEILGAGALLHDIGKIYIDSRVLNKPGELTAQEYEQMKFHTRAGYQALKKRAPQSLIIPRMALEHHELEDGSGYPMGLKGRSIHRFAKIIAAADVFDAMTSARVYNKPFSPSVAIQRMNENAPVKYNQEVVACLKKLIMP